MFSLSNRARDIFGKQEEVVYWNKINRIQSFYCKITKIQKRKEQKLLASEIHSHLQ